MLKVRGVIASLLIGSMLTMSGCFGKFALVQKVWGFNNSLGNKFLNTLLFWVFAFILPVYEIAATVDVVIFNLIEFWTGNNPIAMKDGEKIEKIANANGQPVKLTFENHGQDVTIDAAGKTFSLHVDGTSAVLRNGEGRVLSESRQLADGGIEVRNGEGDVVVSKTAGEARAWASLLHSSTDLFVQQFDVERGTRLASAR